MRLAILAAALALLGASGRAAASEDRIPVLGAGGAVPVAPLARDEVLLELNAVGISRRPADRITVSVPITRTAATPAAARADVAAEAERIAAAAKGLGIPAGDVRFVPNDSSRMGLVGVDPELLMGMTEEDGAPRPKRHVSSGIVEIRLAAADGYERLRQAVETEATAVPSPAYSLSDPEPASREAQSDALRRARAEAEDYAKHLGLRVVRLVRVSARRSEYSEMVELMGLMRPTQASDGVVETRVAIGADFALGPAR
jgi:uncharacterized protein YggE